MLCHAVSQSKFGFEALGFRPQMSTEIHIDILHGGGVLKHVWFGSFGVEQAPHTPNLKPPGQ